MGDTIFWLIGWTVSVLAALVLLAFALIWLWANFIHGRFGSILLRKSERRMSLASWHRTRVVNMGNERDDNWPADDWPINERPFYLSYKIGERRLFFMIGLLGPHRSSPIRGRCP